ncbi:hypothetical protein ABTY20_18960 [Streptomyces sp. NPDC126497]|uniref:hypothetical protein n=1 Tax=Streptomyces sp. NPDC126497 TaxID=3155313 RepID=UPI003328FDE3
MSETKYQVLFQGGDGREQLSDPESKDDARHTARELERKGYSVGSVMDVDSAREYVEYRYAPTYRGVTIPDDVRNDGVPRSVYDAWRRGVDSMLETAAPLLTALADAEHCEFDASGACLTHDYPPPLCADGEAQKLLKGMNR